MKRMKLILPLALLLLLLAIALYPQLHAAAEKRSTDGGEPLREAAASEAAPLDSATDIAASVSVGGSIDTDSFPLTDGQQQALHRYMTAYYTTLGDLTEPDTDGVFCDADIAAYEQAVCAASWSSAPLRWRTSPSASVPTPSPSPTYPAARTGWR